MRPYFKTIRAKRAGGVAQTIELLPSKQEALSSNSNMIKKTLYFGVFQKLAGTQERRPKSLM
jgi:hypothetical protein